MPILTAETHNALDQSQAKCASMERVVESARADLNAQHIDEFAVVAPSTKRLIDDIKAYDSALAGTGGKTSG